MRSPNRRTIALYLLLCGCPLFGQWTPVNRAPHNLQTCLLLTNGDVMCHEGGTNHWHRLTPDANGSYVNGSWDAPGIADMPNGSDTSNVNGLTCAPCTYAPAFFASAVLADGRVVVVGGEFNSNGATWTNIGFLYDPVTNSWSKQLSVPFPAGVVGDSQSVVLPDGRMLIANLTSGNVAAFQPGTLSFTALNPSGKLDPNSEAGWTILPDGRVLTVDAGVPNQFEIFDPATNKWGSTGTTAGVNLTSIGGNCSTREVGPAVIRPDGTILQFGASTTGQNAVYNIATGTWSHAAAMDFPMIGGRQYGTADAPASLLPGGSVLVQASPVDCRPDPSSGGFTMADTPSHFFEWDGAHLTQVADAAGASAMISFFGRMLLLPTGEVLFTGGTVTQVYASGMGPQEAWRPVIQSSPATLLPGGTYSVSGRQFNGFSEGAAYGDDAQMATNYPLVRIRNKASGHVFYARTHGHSRMGVEAVGSASVVSTNFDVPAGVEIGASTLEVVANGIASSGFDISVAGPPSLQKSFGAAGVLMGGSTTLTFTLVNPPANTVTLRGVSFSDTFPGGLAISTATPLANNCGVEPLVSASTVSLSGVTLPPGGSCAITFSVTGIGLGIWTNTAVAHSSNAGTGAPASATLGVYSMPSPPALAESFDQDAIPPGGTATLTFTVSNPGAIALHGVGFADPLPAGLTALGPGTSTCGGKTTVSAGTIQLTGATLAGQSSCTVKAQIAASGGATGRRCNLTGPVISTDGGVGGAAFACVALAGQAVIPTDAYQVGYAVNLRSGDSAINLTNAGTFNGEDPAGNICVNIYALDPEQELIACCACLVGPNGLRALSGRNDLSGNALAAYKPDGMVIKLVASHPVGSACDPSTPTTQNLMPGMRGWNTTLHKAGDGFKLTELPFRMAELSESELSKLTGFCAFIQSNGGGLGICRSCRPGGMLGGEVR